MQIRVHAPRSRPAAAASAAPRRRRATTSTRARTSRSRPAAGGRSCPPGIAIAIPSGYAGFVLPRSGLALHHGITCLNTPGLIDPLYRGELKVLLVNTDPSEPYTVQPRRPHRAARRAARRARWSGSRSTSSTPPSRDTFGFGSTGVDGEARPFRPFRFGVQAASPASAEGWREQARRIEALGYSTLFMPDHFVGTRRSRRWSRSRSRPRSPTTLRIGMLVLGNDYKHPAVVAKEAATLDVLSDGRLEFGLGAGWMTRRLRPRSVFPTTRPGVRIDRLAEAIEVVKGAWAPGPFDFSGEHYTIRDYDAVPEAGPAAAPADPPRWRWPQDARGSPGGSPTSSGINPNLRAGEISADVAREQLAKTSCCRRSSGSAKARGTGSTRSSSRSATSADRDHRRRTRVRRALAPLFDITADEALASSVVLVGHRRRDLRHARATARGVGCVVRRDRRRRVRRLRAGRRPPRRHLTKPPRSAAREDTTISCPGCCSRLPAST